MEFRVEGYQELIKAVSGVSLANIEPYHMAAIDHLLGSCFKRVPNHPDQRQAELLGLCYGLWSDPMSNEQLAEQFKIVPMSVRAKVERSIRFLQDNFMQEFVNIIKPSLEKNRPDDLFGCRKRIAELEEEVRQLRGILAKIAEQATLPPVDPNSIKLKDLGLTNRIMNIFRRLKIETVEQLLKYSAAELLKMQNFGRTCLIELNQKLCLNGFQPIK